MKDECSIITQKETVNGTIINGLESRFPLLAISNWTPAVVYKIPSSIFFVETLELLTKAQRNKYEALQPKIGDDVTFEAVNDIVVAIKEAPSKLEQGYNNMYQYQFKDIYKNHYQPGTTIVKCKYVISPDEPLRCWTDFTEYLPMQHIVSNLKGALRNVVYDVYIRIRPKFVNKEDSNSKMTLDYEFIEFSQPCPATYSNYEILQKMEWNKNLFILYGIKNVSVQKPINFYDENKSDTFDPTSLITNEYKDAKFYYFENKHGEVSTLFPLNPRRKILLSTVDSEVIHRFKIRLPVKKEKSVLEKPTDGSLIRADLFFCRVNHAYIACNYIVLSARYPATKIRSKMDVGLDGNMGKSTYLITVRPSKFPGFYQCHQLGKVLISDPNSLLRNVNFEENGKWRAVWIELNEFDRIDKCSIVALHKEPGRYRDNELPVFRSPWLAKPEISDFGYLVNRNTGRVFCRRHPHDRIILSVVDRRAPSIDLGSCINFRAVYHQGTKDYIVIAFELNEFEESIPYRRKGNDVLFIEDNLFCFSRQCLNTHVSSKLGFVSDPRLFGTALMLRKQKWPTSLWNHDIQAFIVFTEVVKFSGTSMFELHSLSTIPDDCTTEITIRPKKPVTVKEEECHPSTSEQDCVCERCTEIAFLCENFLRNDKSLAILKQIGKLDEVIAGAELYGKFMKE